MKRFLIPALSLLLAAQPLLADDQTDRDGVVRGAREMIEAMFKGNMHAVLPYFNRTAMKAVGGNDEMVKKAIDQLAAQMKETGLEFVSMEVEPPEKIHHVGDKTFALADTKTVMQIPKKVRITQSGTMIAIREAAGGPWTFVRVNEQLAGSRTLLQKAIPGIPDELVVQPPAKPVSEPLSK